MSEDERQALERSLLKRTVRGFSARKLTKTASREGMADANKRRCAG